MSETQIGGKPRRRWPTLRHSLKEDYRGRLPLYLSRFLGYRPPGAKSPFEPLPFPPFSWLKHISMQQETLIFGWIGAFLSMLLIEAIMSASTEFRDVYRTPLIITSFGASAVLLFGLIDSPLSQPTHLVFGHFVSALSGVCITRLFVLNPRYQGYLENTEFHATISVCGALSMATSLTAMTLLNVVHPPAGATGLNAAVQANVVLLSWRYLPTVLASSAIMLGFACFFNNLGRRRYPSFWIDPNFQLVAPAEKMEEP